MGTVGEEVLRRINEIEARLGELQGDERTGIAGTTGSGFPLPPSASNRVAMDQLAEIRRRIDAIETGGTRNPGMGARNFMSPKDMMPGVFGSANFRDEWRSWSYKARDWLSQWDETLNYKSLLLL